MSAPSLSSSTSEEEEIQLDHIESSKTLTDIYESLQDIGESPVRLYALPVHCRTTYGKRKLEKINDTVGKKLKRVLD